MRAHPGDKRINLFGHGMASIKVGARHFTADRRDRAARLRRVAVTAAEIAARNFGNGSALGAPRTRSAIRKGALNCRTDKRLPRSEMAIEATMGQLRRLHQRCDGERVDSMRADLG